MGFLNETGLERLWAHILAKVGTKVDKVDGKGLSTNDYTDEDKNKILENSEAVNSLTALVGNKSVSEQISEAINEIPAQVQSDWNQTDSTKPDYIKNKPDETLITVDDIDTICNANIEYANLDEGAF